MKPIHITCSSLILTTVLMGCAPEVRIVSVEPATINFIDRDQSQQLTAKALELRSQEVPDVTLTFRSDNPGVAEVSASGLVTPMRSGSATILVTAPNGKQAQTFVKVCLPEKIVCEPNDVLQLRVGTASPLKCRFLDCNDEPVPGSPEYAEADKEAVYRDRENTFIGRVVGRTEVTVSGKGLETVIPIIIGEQIFSPGMGPGGGGGGGGRGGNETERRNKDPYNEKGHGQFSHILKNI